MLLLRGFLLCEWDYFCVSGIMAISGDGMRLCAFLQKDWKCLSF